MAPQPTVRGSSPRTPLSEQRLRGESPELHLVGPPRGVHHQLPVVPHALRLGLVVDHEAVGVESLSDGNADRAGLSKYLGTCLQVLERGNVEKTVSAVQGVSWGMPSFISSFRF